MAKVARGVDYYIRILIKCLDVNKKSILAIRSSGLISSFLIDAFVGKNLYGLKCKI